MMSKGRFLHLGQVIVDFTLLVDRLPERGGDIFASRSGVHAGGGYNVLYAARKMGAESFYVGAIGDGAMADVARKALDDIGVHVSGVQLNGVDTGICVAMTEPDGERTFVSTRGAETMVPHDFYENFEISDDDVIYLSGYSFSHVDNRTALERFARSHAHRTGFTLFDVGPMVADLTDESIEAISLLHPLWSVNERESAILCARFALEATDDYAQRCVLLAQYLHAAVLVRAGSKGAWFYDGSTNNEASYAVAIPTPTVHAIDTNGAGDAHAGVLCAAVLEGMELVDSLMLANCAGALSTQEYGPATCPNRDVLEKVKAALV
ncbi:PfkB family carbohydrate kinase [Alloscardovia omnicolens]|uniref:PfkB family carbohydrate kinase n=1 Tax=Alloscardovia omnicolens TaxID=419015 RepID=UPI003A72A1F2